MSKKLKIDPNKVEYDGSTFKLVIEDFDSLMKKLKEKQEGILKDMGKESEIDVIKKRIQEAEEVIRLLKNIASCYDDCDSLYDEDENCSCGAEHTVQMAEEYLNKYKDEAK